jgi:hypothetical protein
VPLLEGLLIDADVLDDPVFPQPKAAIDRPLHDAVDLIPAQPQGSRDRADRHLLQQRDCQALEQCRKSAAALAPRHLNLPDAILGALNTRTWTTT